jgi:hypothetical protein
MKSRKHNLAWAGVVVAAALWLAEAALDAWAFRRSTFTESLFPRDVHEIWMRTLSASLVMAFGLYARVAAVALHKVEAHERALEHELDDALARLLADFIPICAGCKSIREDDRWVRVEQYVTEHTGSRFSHGLCPACLKSAESELEN